MAIQITTRTTDKDLTGRSHWWGAPDMPEGMAYPCIEVEDEDGGRYPEPLTFVCQVCGYCGAGSGGAAAAQWHAVFLRTDRLFSGG